VKEEEKKVKEEEETVKKEEKKVEKEEEEDSSARSPREGIPLGPYRMRNLGNGG
jgi:hypothetical protein